MNETFECCYISAMWEADTIVCWTQQNIFYMAMGKASLPYWPAASYREIVFLYILAEGELENQDVWSSLD